MMINDPALTRCPLCSQPWSNGCLKSCKYYSRPQPIVPSIADIRDTCPRCGADEALHPRHPWDCSITPEEWREFYATPWPAFTMWRSYLIASGHEERWP